MCRLHFNAVRISNPAKIYENGSGRGLRKHGVNTESNQAGEIALLC